MVKYIKTQTSRGHRKKNETPHKLLYIVKSMLTLLCAVSLRNELDRVREGDRERETAKSDNNKKIAK